jgi:hypothetical protein
MMKMKFYLKVEDGAFFFFFLRNFFFFRNTFLFVFLHCFVVQLFLVEDEQESFFVKQEKQIKENILNSKEKYIAHSLKQNYFIVTLFFFFFLYRLFASSV